MPQLSDNPLDEHGAQKAPRSFVHSIAGRLKADWRTLVAADLLYKLLAFVILTPLLAGLFRCLLAVAGESVLSDVDIAMFLAGPFGWFCAIVLGAVWLGIVALEQASLLSILAARQIGKKLGTLDSLRFAASHAPAILRVSGRLIGWSLLATAPFILLAGGTYYWLLGEFDINYYLNERPTEFKIAVGIGVILAIVLTGILLRLYSGWFLALPLVLFAKTSPKTALRASATFISGKRRRVFAWLVVWLFVVVAANVILTAIAGAAGRWLIPASVGSLAILATRVGLLLLVLVASGLVLNLFATIGFAGVLFHGYREIDPDSDKALEALPFDDRQRKHSVFTPARITAGAMVALLVAALFGYWSLNKLQLQDDLQIMAHRGASKAAPENTMAAFRQAIEDGADWIELDVQETADGEVVVLHDSDFMKLSANPLKIWGATQAQLGDIDIGSWFDPRFAEERVPTLADVLKLCKGRVRVNIELKYYGHDQQLEQRVVDVVEAEGMTDQIMIMSLKPEGVAKIKALRPDWKCGLLLSVHVGNLQKINADFLAVNARFATRNFVRRAHKANKQVFVWTVNDTATMSQMMNRKVDGILTDRPDLAQQVLRERAEMNNSERLLAELAILLNQPEPISEP